MDNKIYIMPETREDSFSAWQKAPSDIAQILQDAFGADAIDRFVKPVQPATRAPTLPERVRNILKKISFYSKCAAGRPIFARNSIFLMQHPYNVIAHGRWEPMLGNAFVRLALHRVHSVLAVIIHDIEEIRLLDGKNQACEAKTMRSIIRRADYIIVHNRRMADWFRDKGADDRKIIELGIFDYLSGYEPPCDMAFERAVTIAGALRVDKSAYIAKLPEIQNVTWHLYGKGFNPDKVHGDNIHYHGVFPSVEIPAQMRRGFGLVWDGESIDTCSGLTGAYLRYNNPHKLSLYLASGLPVIIWNEAAEADFVTENGLGFTVSSLREIEPLLAKVDVEKYKNIRNNVLKVSKKLKDGYFTKRAVREIMERMNRRAGVYDGVHARMPGGNSVRL